MRKIIIKTIETRRGTYIYDRNTHTVIPVDRMSFEDFRTYEQGKTDKEHCPALQKFCDMGVLEENVVEEIRHPDTDFLEHYAKCRVRQVVLQVTQQCNLRCAYCAYSGNYFTREHCDKKMTFETAKKAIDYAISHSGEVEEMCFSFYGGEPLLEFGLIQECVSYVKKCMGERKYTFTMTTNGTLLTPPVVKFLSENQFSIHVSLDGPKEEHDQNRKFRTGKGSFDTIMKNIARIKEQDYEFWKKLGFMITLNPKVDLKKITEFFDHTELIPKRAVQYHEVEETNLKNQEWVHYQNTFRLNRKYMYLKALMYLAGMLEEKQVDRMFRTTCVMKQKFFDGLKKGRYMRKTVHHGGPCVPGMRKIFVAVDGTFYPCEKVVENESVFSIGNVDEGLCISKMEPILNLGRLTEKQCMNCPALQSCDVCIARIEGGDKESFVTAEKKLEICQKTRQTFINELHEYCVINECRIENTHNKKEKAVQEPEKLFEAEELPHYGMEKLEIPVLVVLGQGEQCSKAATFARACEFIRAKGYRVLGIGVDPAVCGRENRKLADFFLDKTEGFEKKVLNLNKYVKELCDREDPDIVVVEIPGGVFPVSEKEHFYFGELLEVVSSALDVDAAIFNMYYNVCKMDAERRDAYLAYMKESCMGKYQFPVDFFCVSPHYMKLDPETRKADYLCFNEVSTILKNTERQAELIYLWENSQDFEKKMEKLLERLESNTDVV